MTDKVDITPTRNRIRDGVNRTNDPAVLVRLAGILGTKVEYLPDEIRPNFGPDQVRSMCELRKGHTYEEVHNSTELGRSSTTFVVVEEPFHSEHTGCGPGWWMKVRYTDTGREIEISLHDRNIHPYSHGRWNKSNWIAFTDDSRHLKHLACCCHCSHEHHCNCPDGHTHSHHHGC